MFTIFGLGLISLAWIYQLVGIVDGNKKIRIEFVLVYVIGVTVLVVDAFMAGLTSIAFFNLISLMSALLVGAAIMKKK